MKRKALVLAAACCVMALMGSQPAFAQAKRTFVSGKGSDAGTCSLTAPCRSFAYAASQTAAGGELAVLDAAGYGPVLITQSISIVNDGVGTASITVPANQVGIEINAGSSDRVHLRGIEIDGNGTSGTMGIQVDSVGALDVFHSVVRHADFGIISGSGTPKIHVVDSVVSDHAAQGFQITGGTLAIEGSTITGTYQGVLTGGSTYATIARSTVSGNQVGLAINGSSRAFIRDCVVSDNSIAGISTSGGIALTSHDIITANGIGLKNISGQMISYSDNNLNWNLQQDATGNLTKYSSE